MEIGKYFSWKSWLLDVCQHTIAWVLLSKLLIYGIWPGIGKVITKLIHHLCRCTQLLSNHPRSATYVTNGWIRMHHTCNDLAGCHCCLYLYKNAALSSLGCSWQWGLLGWLVAAYKILSWSCLHFGLHKSKTHLPGTEYLTHNLCNLAAFAAAQYGAICTPERQRVGGWATRIWCLMSCMDTIPGIASDWWHTNQLGEKDLMLVSETPQKQSAQTAPGLVG
jgi:hypothetical protein